MLLNQVVMGRTVKLQTIDKSLTQPPNGADSVVGEVRISATYGDEA
jgi:hypothetical protein